MGLGKTVQVIAFIANLLEENQELKFMIIVPSSTLDNWTSEFDKFCPEISVARYYGISIGAFYSE